MTIRTFWNVDYLYPKRFWAVTRSVFSFPYHNKFMAQYKTEQRWKQSRRHSTRMETEVERYLSMANRQTKNSFAQHNTYSAQVHHVWHSVECVHVCCMK